MRPIQFPIPKRIAMTAGGSLLPMVAFAQNHGAEVVIMQSDDLIKTSYPKATSLLPSSDVVEIVTFEGRQIAQAQPSPLGPPIAASDASSPVSVSPGFLQQLAWYSATAGGFAGGLVAFQSSGGVSDQTGRSVSVNVGGGDQTGFGANLYNLASIRLGNIFVSEPGTPTTVTVSLYDNDGLDKSYIEDRIEYYIDNYYIDGYTLGPDESLTVTGDSSDLILGTEDTYTKLQVTYVGDLSEFTTGKDWLKLEFVDGDGNKENVDVHFVVINTWDGSYHGPVSGAPTPDVEYDGRVEDFGDYYSSFGSSEIVNGTAKNDQLTFGYRTVHDQGNLTVDGFGGHDQVVFGDDAANNTGANITLNNLDGDQSYSFGSYAGGNGGSVSITAGAGAQSYSFGVGAGNDGGSVSITAGDGNHSYSFGLQAGDNGGSVSISAGNGDHSYSFGFRAGHNGGSVSITAGNGDHSYSFGYLAGSDSGSLSITAGDGNHSYSFGSDAGANGGSLSITAGDGNHSYSFSGGVGRFGSVSITSGNGDNAYSFGDVAGDNGSLSINAGDGNQTYSFGSYAGYNGSVSIAGGAGISSYTFGDQAGRGGGNITLDLVSDNFNDTIVFDGPVGSIFIQNYSITYDDKVDVVVPSTWSGTDNGTDIVFTQSDQTITFEGLGGIGGSTDPLDYFM